MRSKRICFVILAIFVCEIRTEGSESCLNGGELIDGVCACPPEYTGADCDVKINAKNGTTMGLEACFSHSGSGSASGSGYDTDGAENCENPDQIWIEDKCQAFSQFEGSVMWKSTQQLQDLQDTSLADYVTIKKGALCALKKIFENQPVGEIIIEEILSETTGIRTRFILKTSNATVLPEITTLLQSAQNSSSDVIMKIHIQDYDECERQTHDCHRVAKCVNNDGGYRCECPADYSSVSKNGTRPGSLCRHICKVEFEEDYCLNAGNCSVTMDRKAICECALGFTGPRCQQHWAVYYYITIGLAASFGLFIVVFAMVVLMLWARPRLGPPKTRFQAELEDRLQNGDKHTKKKRRDVKGISNPYVSAEEGITVPTKITDDERVNSSDEEDRL